MFDPVFLGQVRMAQAPSPAAAPAVNVCAHLENLGGDAADRISIFNQKAKEALANGDMDGADSATKSAQQASDDWSKAKADLTQQCGVPPTSSGNVVPFWATVLAVAVVGVAGLAAPKLLKL